jgi:hypothetical protein
MSLEGMIQRIQLRRAHDAGITKCVAVVVIGELRYEQDQMGLSWPSILHTFPELDCSEEVLIRWADRIIQGEQHGS